MRARLGDLVSFANRFRATLLRMISPDAELNR